MHIAAEQEYMEEMQPFTEEDLSILYPNAQLDTQSVLVDTFIRVRNTRIPELRQDTRLPRVLLVIVTIVTAS